MSYQSFTKKQLKSDQELLHKTVDLQCRFQNAWTKFAEDGSDPQTAIALGEELMQSQERLQKSGGSLSPVSVMHRVEIIKDAIRKGKAKPAVEETDEYSKRLADARAINKVYDARKAEELKKAERFKK